MKTLVVLLMLAPCVAWCGDTVNVGSKRFTESYILAEIVAQTIDRAGEAAARHRPGLGNTAVVFAALRNGAIDIYPDYSGTIALELLRLPIVPSMADLDTRLARYHVRAGIPLGFSNGYALAMSRDRAESLHISRISDLAQHPELRLGLTHEFLNREDGWPALAPAYGLGALHPVGLDHGLAYEAVERGQVDVIDVYETDAKLAKFRLTLLVDDRHFFPRYDALLVFRDDFAEHYPRSWSALQSLQGRISAKEMRMMNAEAELSGIPFSRVAAQFLSSSDVDVSHKTSSFTDTLFGDDFWRLTAQHAMLVFVSLAFSVAFGIPLGVWASRKRSLRAPILGVAGVLQTVPSLALLALLIALLNRIGTIPAIVALFLYALLPIVRNTEAGLAGVPYGLTESAIALGLSPRQRLALIDLPLALPVIVAGIRTAAVINVGTATIAAFVGAGGYGERIVAGLAVNNRALLLAGALPAAGMALLIEAFFSLLERSIQADRVRSRSLQFPSST